MTAIAARGLTKRFASKSVLQELDLSIPEGSIYGLLGRNGAGKTTLMKLAIGLWVPSAGEITVLGKSLVEGTAADKARVGYVGEKSILPSWMRVDDLLGFERRVRPVFDDATLLRRLDREGIALSSLIPKLSKGQLRRLDLEVVLAASPAVLILDEPFDGLDPVARGEVMEALLAHAASAGCTVLLSSHVLGDLERLCDRIGVLAVGRIAFESELDALKESTAVVFGDPALANGSLSRGVEIIGRRSEGRGTTWLVRNLPPDRERLLQAEGLQVLRPGLEELGRELLSCLDDQGLR